jgi:anti-sigma B factor antagonist
MSGEMSQVRLVSVPVEIWRRASLHQEAVQRELDIIQSSLPDDAAPNRFSRLVAELDARFGRAGDPTWARLREAAEKGDEQVDLVFVVPVETAEASRRLDRTLDDLDAFCLAGDKLLTLATPEELVRFRRWFLGEFTRQIEGGHDPMPWGEQAPQPDQLEEEAQLMAHPEPTAHPGGETRIDFAGDLDISTAGALRDRILEAKASGSSTVVIDLTRVEFMDSVGISLLVSAHNRAIKDGLEMTLILPMRLKPLVEMTGLLDLLKPQFVEVAL